MRNAMLALSSSLALLIASPFAVSANCYIYEASVPTTISQGETGISASALAHTVVVRDAGFKLHPYEFFIFPNAISKDRFSLGQPAPSPTPASTPVTSGPSGLAITTITPMPPGVNDRFPTPGHMVVMSNTAFYGDVISTFEPASVAQTVSAAIDLGTFSQVLETGFTFEFSPSSATANVVVARTQPDAAVTPKQLPVTQATVTMTFVADSKEIFSGLNAVIVDSSSTPPAQFQYSAIVEGKFIKTVSC